MTIRTNWFTMDNKAGVNLNVVVASVTVTNNPTQPEYPGIPHNLGDRVQGNNGSEWLFVKASATISCFNLIAIDSGFNAATLTSALIASGSPGSPLYLVAIAETQTINGVTGGNATGGVINPGEEFWALMKCAQGARVNAAASATISPGAGLYLSGTSPGCVTSSAGTSAAPGGGKLNGLMAISSVDSATASVPASLEVGFFSYIIPGVFASVYPISTTA